MQISDLNNFVKMALLTAEYGARVDEYKGAKRWKTLYTLQQLNIIICSLITIAALIGVSIWVRAIYDA
jgi:hypothetical protein